MDFSSEKSFGSGSKIEAARFFFPFSWKMTI